MINYQNKYHPQLSQVATNKRFPCPIRNLGSPSLSRTSLISLFLDTVTCYVLALLGAQPLAKYLPPPSLSLSLSLFQVECELQGAAAAQVREDGELWALQRGDEQLHRHWTGCSHCSGLPLGSGGEPRKIQQQVHSRPPFNLATLGTSQKVS